MASKLVSESATGIFLEIAELVNCYLSYSVILDTNCGVVIDPLKIRGLSLCPLDVCLRQALQQRKAAEKNLHIHPYI